MNLPLDDLADVWPELDALLDEALALPAPRRDAWLDALSLEPTISASVLATLRRLLATGPDDTGRVGGAEAGARLSGATGHDWLDAPPAVLPPEEQAHADAGAQVGPWRLITLLGSGGMGEVWRAERADGTLQRPVALKLPHVAWGRGLTDRLARERDILATLSHPNIARLYDAGVDEAGRPWLALELVEGLPIDEYCGVGPAGGTGLAGEASGSAAAMGDGAIAAAPAAVGSFGRPFAERIGLLLQVCEAVAHAHRHLVIHRDLKPSNILVTADGQVRLLDFGIAKLLGDEGADATALTRLGGRPMSLDHASPEQVRGEVLTTATDIYSLGVVAYEVLTGRSPYRLRRGTAAELETAIGEADVPVPSTVAAPSDRHALRGDLDAIVMQALQRAPASRYASVDAFADDLRRHLAHRPIRARPTPWAQRVAKAVRRHRLPVAAGAVATLALLAGTGLAAWQARVATQQAARAEDAKRLVLAFYASAGSDEGGTPRTTAVEFLRKLRNRLHAEQGVVDPELRIEMLTALGRVQFSLGDLQPSRETLAEAHERALSAAAGEGAELRASTAVWLANALTELNELDAAEPLLTDAMATLSRDPSMDSEALVAGELVTASLSAQRGDREATLSALDRALAQAGTRLPPNHPLQVTVRAERVNAKYNWDDPGARAAADELMAFARTAGLAADSPSMINVRTTWLETDPPGVDKLVAYAALEADALSVLGEAHPLIARIRQSYSLHLRRAGDVDGGVTKMRQVLAAEDAELGPEPGFHRGMARMRLGSALLDAARADEAVAVLREGMAMIDHTRRAPSSSPLALALLARAQAEAGHAEGAAQALAELSPLRDEMSADDLQRAGVAELSLGRLPQARLSAEEALKGHTALADAAGQAVDRRLLALIALADGRAAEALPVLQARLDRLRRSGQPLPTPETARLCVALSRAHLLLAGDASRSVQRDDVVRMHLAAALSSAEDADLYWRRRDPDHFEAREAAAQLQRARGELSDRNPRRPGPPNGGISRP